MLGDAGTKDGGARMPGDGGGKASTSPPPRPYRLREPSVDDRRESENTALGAALPLGTAVDISLDGGGALMATAADGAGGGGGAGEGGSAGAGSAGCACGSVVGPGAR